MSRGPGRVERSIEAAFRDHPSETFTTSELAIFAFPGLNRVEKKHRVSLRRAAYAVAHRMHWIAYRCERPGGDIVFCNGLNLASYVMGKARSDFIWNGRSVDEIAYELQNPSDYPYAQRWHDLNQQCGVFADHVEINRLVAAGDAAGAARARAGLRRRVLG